MRWILRLSAWCSPPFRDDYTTAGRNATTQPKRPAGRLRGMTAPH
nr:MAG TPA: hypothetical protein [Caudoviricetes sp.]